MNISSAIQLNFFIRPSVAINLPALPKKDQQWQRIFACRCYPTRQWHINGVCWYCCRLHREPTGGGNVGNGEDFGAWPVAWTQRLFFLSLFSIASSNSTCFNEQLAHLSIKGIYERGYCIIRTDHESGTLLQGRVLSCRISPVPLHQAGQSR